VLAFRVAASIGVALIVLDLAGRALHAEELNHARAMVLARIRMPKRAS
jgi:hypothetical protein